MPRTLRALFRRARKLLLGERLDDATRALRARDHQDNLRMRRIIEESLRSNSCAIDVGAHTGEVLRQILANAPDGTHHAFEPIPRLALKLRKQFPDLSVHEVALGACAATSSFHDVVSNPGYSGLELRTLDREDETVVPITVEVLRLDDVIPESEHIDLIKIDVEGGELGVLEGARQLLARCQPIILFEHGKQAARHYGTTPEMIHALLSGDLDYEIFGLDGAGPFDSGGLEAVFETGSAWNFVARPTR